MPDSDTIEDTPEPTEDEPAAEDVHGEDDAVEAESSEDETEPETFSRSYVEELRQENGKYRQRAAKADTYAQRLHTELVRATGKLADPTDRRPGAACVLASRRARRPWRRGGRPVKSDKGPHLRRRVALTLPRFCGNEPIRRGHG